MPSARNCSLCDSVERFMGVARVFAICLSLVAVMAGVNSVAEAKLESKGPRLLKVVLLSNSGDSIRELTVETDLSRFSRLWEQRESLPEVRMEPIEFPFSIRIEKDRGEVWFYHPAGLIKILSKADVPVWRLKDPAHLNELLGINSEKQKSSLGLPKSGEICRKVLEESVRSALQLDENDPSWRNSELANENFKKAKAFEKLKWAVVLALAGERHSLEHLRNVKVLTSSQVEFFLAKSALLILGEKIPEALMKQRSVFQDRESLFLHCHEMMTRPNSAR